MKSIASHILRSSFRPKPGPQAVGVYVADGNQRPEIVKREAAGGNDSDRYFAQFTSVRTVTADTTLTAQDDGALLILNSADPILVTLPSTAAGLHFAFFVKLADNGHGFSPAAADKIFVSGLTAVDDKDLLNSTSAVGAFAEVWGDGADGWFGRVNGTFTMQA